MRIDPALDYLADACRSFGERRAKKAIPLLILSVWESDPGFARTRHGRWAEWGRTPKRLRLLLIGLLQTSNVTDVRVTCAEALGLIAHGNETAKAALRDATNDENEAVRSAAAEALQRMKINEGRRSEARSAAFMVLPSSQGIFPHKSVQSSNQLPLRSRTGA